MNTAQPASIASIRHAIKLILLLFGTSQMAFAQSFITTWQTDNPGTSAANQITIPTTGGGYSYDIYWEEAGNPTNNANEATAVTGNYTITFPSAGTYRVEITGTFPRIFFSNGGDKDKILTVEQWGNIAWTSMQAAFYGCTNLTSNAIDSPDLTLVTSMNQMFDGAIAFNSDISGWDVSSVLDMTRVFNGATLFNQPLNGWDVSNVTTMNSMFSNAAAFNQPLDQWVVSSVTDMGSMFFGATSFDENITTWDVGIVSDMSNMFSGAVAFDQDIGGWNVGGVSNMNSMFYQASVFNQDISGWNTESVTQMQSMFALTGAFNQDITGWVVSGVTDMSAMFNQATFFNQNIGTWDISGVFNMSSMLNNAGLSTANYDNILTGWAAQTAQSGVTLGAIGLSYCASVAARNVLISTFGWTITGDTEFCPPAFAGGSGTPGDPWHVSTPEQMGFVRQVMDDYFVLINDIDMSFDTGDPSGLFWNGGLGWEPYGVFGDAFDGNFDGNGYKITGLFIDRPAHNDVGLFGRISTAAEVWNLGVTEAMVTGNIYVGALMGMNEHGQVHNCYSSGEVHASSDGAGGLIGLVTANGIVTSSYSTANATALNTAGGFVGSSFGTITDSYAHGNAHAGNGGAGGFAGSIVGGGIENCYATGRAMSLFSNGGFVGIYAGGTTTNCFWDIYSSGKSLSAGPETGLVTSAMLQQASYTGWDFGRYWAITEGVTYPSLQENPQLPAPTPGPARLPFITTWKTDNPGTSAATQVTIPTTGTGYKYSVYWEEVGNPSNNGTAGPFDDTNMPHTVDFGTAGEYRVEMSGNIPRIYFNNVGDRQKLLTIEQWGGNVWTSMQNAFTGCSNLTVPATDAPDLKGVWDMALMFSFATSFNQPINHWDVSNVTNIRGMFQSIFMFNQPLDNWDVSNVTNMSFTFSGTGFNQDITGWDLSSVTNTSLMFQSASAFNQDISTWNVGNVTNMSGMLIGTSSFNQNLGSWDIANVTDMSNMLSFSGLSTENYDNTLIGWAAQTVQNGVQLGADNLTYCLGVSARDELTNTFGWSITGDSQCPPPPTPIEPSSLDLKVLGTTAIEGSFDATGAEGYLVVRSASGASTFVPSNGIEYTVGSSPAAGNIVVYVGDALNFVDAGLEVATQYGYSVFAFNGSSVTTVYSVNSIFLFATTLTTAPSDQPTGLVLTLGNSPAISGTFAASASGSDGYIVLRRTAAVSPVPPQGGNAYTKGTYYAGQFVAHSGAETTFTDQVGLLPDGTTVSYDVFAYNGTGGTTNYLTANPLSGDIVLETDEIFNAFGGTDITTSGFVARWDSVPAVKGYRLEVATDEGFASLVPGFDPLTLTDTSKVVTGLYHATRYFFRVTAFDDQLTSTSNAVTVRTLQSAELLSDSTALVRLYDGLGGAGWTSSTGWKSEQVRNWFGVVVENNRVVTLNLPSNNLAGVFPALNGTELNALRQLNLATNALTAFTYSANLANLQTASLSDNQLDFGDLEPLTGISTFTYSPQAEVLETAELLQERGEPLTLDRTVPGTANSYQWHRNGTAIEGATAATIPIAFPTFTEEGAYTATVSNSLLPNLTLTTRPLNLRVSSLERDRLVLTELYNVTGGANWLNNSNWLKDDLSTWFGVTVADNRVTELRLPANNLKGDLPPGLGDLRRLTSIDVTDNLLTSLPPLTNIIALTTLNVSNNKLDFGDLEPNLNIASMVYSPQKPIGSAVNQRLPVNSPYTLDLQVGGSANAYQWFLNGTELDGATSPQLTIDALRFENMGNYELGITSTTIPDLTLRSEVQRLLATANLSGSVINRNGQGVANASGVLLKVQLSAYDSTNFFQTGPSGSYQINSAVLGDYILYARQNIENYLPSYYQGTIDWAFADIIQLRDNAGDLALTLESVPPELTPADGDNSLAGMLESDFGDDGSKTFTRQRVRGAGVTVSRPRFRAKDNEDEMEYELMAYVLTDENGEFEIINLPDGDYRLNIQYPGIPMDPTSFVDFTLGGGAGVEQNAVKISALVTPNGIVVEKVGETGIYLDYFKELTVFPNPADGYLTIRYEKLMKGKVVAELMDLSGQSLLRIHLEVGLQKEAFMDLTNVRSGIYILRFYNKEDQGVDITHWRVIVNK